MFSKFFKLPRSSFARIGLIVFVLMVVVLTVGIINALIGNGAWGIGWSSYRYEEESYVIGPGSVASKSISKIEIDWINGDVEILVCDDAFLSVTEQSEAELPEATVLRRKLSEDGSTLTVKYRKSAAFLGFGGKTNKHLTVRVPRYMLKDLSSIFISGNRMNVSIQDIHVKELTVQTEQGNIAVDCVGTDRMTLKTEKGNTEVRFDESAGFLLQLDADRNRFACDRALQELDEGLLYGDGKAKITIRTPRGRVELKAKSFE